MSYKKQQNQVISHYSYKFTPFPTIKEHKLLKDPKKNFTKKSLEILSEMSSELPSEMPSELPSELLLEMPIEQLSHTTSNINLPRIIYAAAQNLFRHYPINVPVLIYQFHSNTTHTGYDIFMEKTDKGWKEWINKYYVYTEIENNFYLIDGLALAIQQELEMTEILPALMNQSDWLHRLMA